jgi:hypothetical protein
VISDEFLKKYGSSNEEYYVSRGPDGFPVVNIFKKDLVYCCLGLGMPFVILECIEHFLRPPVIKKEKNRKYGKVKGKAKGKSKAGPIRHNFLSSESEESDEESFAASEEDTNNEDYSA